MKIKRRELFAIVKISLGEAPDLKALLREGSSMQEYAEEALMDIVSIAGNDIIEIKTKVEDIEIDEEE